MIFVLLHAWTLQMLKSGLDVHSNWFDTTIYVVVALIIMTI